MTITSERADLEHCAWSDGRRGGWDCFESGGSLRASDYIEFSLLSLRASDYFEFGGFFACERQLRVLWTMERLEGPGVNSKRGCY